MDGRLLDEFVPWKSPPGIDNGRVGGDAVGHTGSLCASWRNRAAVLRDQEGWVTAEYSMLPRATARRTPEKPETVRAHAVRRLIGRSLRAVVDLNALGSAR
jgi:ribonuclease PH